MIRLVLLALAVFLSWVLFVSEFNKRQKITICVIAVMVTIFALWFEQSGQTPKDDLIAVSEIVDCGVRAEHSYRTNFDIEFCITNIAAQATAIRISIDFSALDCESGDCVEFQTVNKVVRVTLAPGESTTLTESLDFDQVDESVENIVWSTKIISVKALR